MTGDRDRRKERASRRRSHRRNEILAASRRVFSARGYHRSSVADIIGEARIARGTFYLYFPSKRALFEALLEEMIGQITGAVSRVTVDDGLESAMEQLAGNVERVIDVLESNRNMTIILLREAVGLDADFDLKLTTFYQRMSDLVDRALRLGQEMGLVRECNTRLASHCVLGSLKEVMLHRLTGGEEVTSSGLARAFLDFNLHGLFLPSER